MNWIDILLLAVLIFFVIKGWIRGIILEAFTLIGMVVAYVLALRQVGWAASVIAQYIEIPPVVATTLGFLFIFITVVIIFRIVAVLLHGIIKRTPVKTLNRGGGIFIGCLKGVLIASLVAHLLAIIPAPYGAFTKERHESILLDPIKNVAPLLFNSVKRVIPETRAFSDELQEGLNEALKEAQAKAMKKTTESLEKQLEETFNPDATDKEISEVLESE